MMPPLGTPTPRPRWPAPCRPARSRGSGRPCVRSGALASRMAGVPPPALHRVALDADAVIGRHLDLAVLLRHPDPARGIGFHQQCLVIRFRIDVRLSRLAQGVKHSQQLVRRRHDPLVAARRRQRLAIALGLASLRAGRLTGALVLRVRRLGWRVRSLGHAAKPTDCSALNHCTALDQAVSDRFRSERLEVMEAGA